ncbi:hypothetical protein N9T15_00825 [Pelagibacteraceae bacterium]|nr:hypothetical protein [Pelagibacteraceae bacterium]
MKVFNYFIPIIHLGPAFGYTYNQILPLERIQNLILGKTAELEICRKVFLNNKLLFDEKCIIKFKNKKWFNKEGASFEWGPSKDKNELSYIETQINLLSGNGLKLSSVPGFYVNYTNPKLKNYLSCSNEKYGNPRVIMQMAHFGIWIDGYPAIHINLKKNTTYSIIIVNPYKIKSSFTLEISNLNIRKTLIVPAFTTKRFSLFNIIKKESWTGQFYIYGKRRAVVYVMNHAFDDINKVSTIEHSDPFRAELTYQPRLQSLRNKIHKKVKSILN